MDFRGEKKIEEMKNYYFLVNHLRQFFFFVKRRFQFPGLILQCRLSADYLRRKLAYRFIFDSFFFGDSK